MMDVVVASAEGFIGQINTFERRMLFWNKNLSESSGKERREVFHKGGCSPFAVVVSMTEKCPVLARFWLITNVPFLSLTVKI